MTDRLGKQYSIELEETSLLIKQKSDWKLMSGKTTNVIPPKK